MLSNYETWIFDCDGVLLDSNKIKSNAFYDVSLRFDEDIAQWALDYHQKNGGISRFKKFKKICEHAGHPELTDDLINQYSKILKKNLIACSETPGMREFVNSIQKSKIIVSGGYEDELKFVFRERNLLPLFDDIYGSPRSKMDIIKDLGMIVYPVIFIGDSKYDYEVANEFGFDFIFMHGFTEFHEWETFFRDKNCQCIQNLTELI